MLGCRMAALQKQRIASIAIVHKEVNTIVACIKASNFAVTFVPQIQKRPVFSIALHRILAHDASLITQTSETVSCVMNTAVLLYANFQRTGCKGFPALAHSSVSSAALQH